MNQFFLCIRIHFIFQIRLFTKYTKSRTRQICDQNICLLLRCFVVYRCILTHSFYIIYAYTRNIITDQIYLVRCQIPCFYMSLSCKLICQMQRLATRCCTHIDNILVLFRICPFRHFHRTDILYLEMSRSEAFQCSQIIISTDK